MLRVVRHGSKIGRAFSSRYRNDSRIVFGESVRHALEHNLPVVALESTIITHGMPFPHNVECAVECERKVLQAGATPATIAILNGRITIGLNNNELEHIGKLKSDVIKTSRRDFAHVVGNKLNGGTTVSGTLVAAQMAGIRVFATGGIGGVHRNGENTLDISADLQEMGRTPIAVVSSGVKSILDIPRTLEYLETQGVYVATFGETNNFPAFYTRESGHKSPYHVSCAREAAVVIKANGDLGLQSGMLFAVPVPEEFAMDAEVMEHVVNEALALAEKRGVHGKEITPFLLSHVAKATEGKSLQTNMSLVQKNAHVAGCIAMELWCLEQDNGNGSTGAYDDQTKAQECRSPIVVIGGSVLDRCVTVLDDEITLNGKIHEGKITESAGGVGRNIFEALSKLSKFSAQHNPPPAFISAVGDDQSAQIMEASLSENASNAQFLRFPDERTAQCIVVFDNKGECRTLIGDMGIHGKLTPSVIDQQRNLIERAPLIVIDANLPMDTMEAIFEIAHNKKIPVFFEPTDHDCSKKPFQTKNWKDAINFISPNLSELQVIAEHLGADVQENNGTVEEVARLAKFVAAQVPNVIVTLGGSGLIIANRNTAEESLMNESKPSNREIVARHYPALKCCDLINVSGAGDCLAAGIIAAMLKGKSEEIAVNVGIHSSHCALKSQSAIPECFNLQDICWEDKAKYLVY